MPEVSVSLVGGGLGGLGGLQETWSRRFGCWRSCGRGGGGRIKRKDGARYRDDRDVKGWAVERRKPALPRAHTRERERRLSNSMLSACGRGWGAREKEKQRGREGGREGGKEGGR